MKKGFMKFTKLLVLTAMIIYDLMTPAMVFASELSSSIPNKGDVGINNEVVNNGEYATVSVGDFDNEGDIKVTKTVKKTNTEGRYEIEFEVKGKEKKNNMWVVVVFDKSGSMNCIKYDDRNRCLNNGTKWSDAVSGAKTFASIVNNALNTNKNDPKAQIALVQFSGSSGYGDVAWNDATVVRNFAASDFSSVNFGSASGGTNLGEGLNKALSLFSDKSSSIKSTDKKYVVVIGDGQPTLYSNSSGYTAGSGSSMDDDSKSYAVTKANALKAKSVGAEIFTIGYEISNNTDAQAVLAEIASADVEGSNIKHNLSASTDNISTAFTNIANSISKSYAGTNASLTDNIGGSFTLTDNNTGTSYTKSIGNITEDGTKFSFFVDIDKDTPTGWYNTNNGFTLVYNDTNGVRKTIECNDNPQVYWVQNTYDYVINYYKDSISSDNYLGNSGIRKAAKDTNIVLNDTDKNAYLANAGEGYEFNSVSPSTLVISTDSSKNVINVLYTKKKFTYKVEYLFEELDGSYKELSSVPSKNNISATYGDSVNALTYNNITIPSGYTFNESKTKGSNNGVYTIKNNEVVIKLYYDREELTYDVVYMFENVNENGYEERPDLVSNKSDVSAKYGEEVTASEHLLSTVPSGFVLNTNKTYEINNGKYTITTNDRIIYIYYDRGSYVFTVNYYFNEVFDNTYSYSNDAVYGTTKSAMDYTLEKVNSKHLADKINSDNEDYFLDPTKNKDSITIGADDNSLGVYYISTSLVPDGNKFEEITKTNNINSITSSSDKVTYTVKYKFVSDIKNIKDGDKVVFTIVDTLPSGIDTTNSSLNGGIYDSSKNTITWTYEEDIDEFTSLYSVNNREITIVYTVLYNDYLSSNGSEMTNTATGKTEVIRNNDVVVATNGVSTSSDVDVNIMGKVTASYIVEGTTTKLCDDVTTNGLVGTDYTTEKKTFFGYSYKTTTGDSASDKYVEGKDLEVTYVYTKNDGNVDNINVGKTGPNTINSVNGAFDYNISGSADVKNYVGDVTLIVKDTLPYTINVSESTIPTSCKYEESTKIITCSMVYKNIKESDYISGKFSVSASFNLKLVFNGINDDEVINKAQTIVDLDGNKTSSDVVEKKTEVLKGSLKVVHRSDSKVLETEDTKTALGGTTYTTNSKSFYGYTLDTSRMPSNASGEYKANETTTVTYYYTNNEGTVNDRVSKVQKNNIMDINSEYHYVLSYIGEVDDYDGEVKLELIDTLPYNANIKSIDSRCTVDGKTIVCKETYNITENSKQISATFDIELVYTSVGREVTNSVKSKLIYGNNTSTKETSVTDRVPYGNLIVKHISDDTLLGTEVYNDVLAGTTYTTSSKSFFGYTYDGNTPVNASGEYKANETVIVVYNYTKNDGEVDDPKTEKIGPDTINSVNGVFEYTINAYGEVKDYVGNITLTVKDMLPYEIDMDKSSLDNRCVYDESTKMITCVQEYNGIEEEDYVNRVYTVNETFEFELVFIGIDSDTVVNMAESTIDLDGNKKTTTGETETVVSKSDVVVSYKDIDGNMLTDDIIMTGLVGTEYTTEEKEFFGYSLKEVNGNRSGFYEEETIYVEYIYVKTIGTGDIEELPPQTGVESGLYDYLILINMIMLLLVGYRKVKETL